MDRKTEELIGRVEEALAELRRHHSGEADVEESDAEKRFRTKSGALLASVDRMGGAVTADQFSALGRVFGYDPRGLGGFAVGKNPSVTSEDDRRVLTQRGRGEAARWIAMYGGKHDESHKAIETIQPPNRNGDTRDTVGASPFSTPNA